MENGWNHRRNSACARRFLTAPGSVLNGRLIFAAAEITIERELWISDGTFEGTTLLKDIYPGPSSSIPVGFTTLNDILLFAANDGQIGHELWRTDGTESGTYLVLDMIPGAAAGGPVVPLSTYTYPVFCPAKHETAGYEPWLTDGTAAGTFLLKDINVGPDFSFPSLVYRTEGLYLFTAEEPSAGSELWSSDGTTDGTQLLADINPGPPSSSPGSFRAFNGMLLFAADDGIHGRELWVMDNPKVPVLSLGGLAFTTVAILSLGSLIALRRSRRILEIH